MAELLQTLEPLILTVHFMVCLFIIVVILLQAGRGADMGAAFGAGSSQTLFGPRGAATLLSKVTTVAALCFLVTSLSLATIHKNRSRVGTPESAVDVTPPQPSEEKSVPSQPPSPPPTPESSPSPKTP